MHYNPALDGLRAVAILLVIGCHVEPYILGGGWIGVDVFFVLSGYLITSILLQELRETGAIDLRAFYFRRALRLFPALAVLCAFQLVRAWFAQDGAGIREATLVGALYLENWNRVFWFAPFDLMGHTWSLATEEQFYLLWPLLLPLAVRRGFVWTCAGVLAMTAARVICWRAGYAETTLDFSLALRPVGLLVGCALAFGGGKLSPWTGTVELVTLGALALLISYGGAFATAPLVASLITVAVIMASPSWLAVAPLRYLGRISYGVYLYHWPLFRLLEPLKPNGGGHAYGIALLALIIAVSALSYELVEKPFLRLKDRISSTPRSSMAAQRPSRCNP